MVQTLARVEYRLLPGRRCKERAGEPSLCRRPDDAPGDIHAVREPGSPSSPALPRAGRVRLQREQASRACRAAPRRDGGPRHAPACARVDVLHRPDRGQGQGRSARPGRGLPREAAVRRKARTSSRRPAVRHREGAVPGRDRRGQGRRSPRRKRRSSSPKSKSSARPSWSRSKSAAQAKLDEATAKQGEAAADLLAQKAALTKAELELGYTDITAPIAGRIGRAAISVGNFVGPSSGTLATIVSQDPIYVTLPGDAARDAGGAQEQAGSQGPTPSDDADQRPARRRQAAMTSPARSISSTSRSTRAPTRCRCARRCRTRTASWSTASW